MVIGPPVSQQTPDAQHHDAEDHQQRHKMSATQECPTLAIRSDPRYAFASALRARSRRSSFSISSMRSSCALISRSRSIRPARIARFAAARLELGGVSSGNETNPRSQHVLERLPQPAAGTNADKVHRGPSDERNGQDNACRGFLTGGDWLGPWSAAETRRNSASHDLL
jgi:hypothetical protein